uniref:Uncharacterized protein n=1 Tax=Panagrolaimus superbus TaxID=310955 RepID=A0A914Z8G5_9BILA
MKYTLLIIYFVVYLVIFNSNNILADKTQAIFKAETSLDTVNETFIWKIKNLQLFDFGTRYNVKSFVSPNLTALKTDDQNGNETIYICQISILPEYQYNRIHYNDYDEFDNFELKKYKISAKFNVVPVKAEYQYIIDGIVYESSLIEKSKLKPGNIVEIIVKTQFYTQNELKES